MRIQKMTGSGPAEWDFVQKGYTEAGRYVMRMEDGSSVFVKAATDEDTARWLRNEYRVYAHLKADFLTQFLVWDDDGRRPVLILEDLSKGFWPPPWSPEHIAHVRDVLKKVAATRPPPGTPSVLQFFQEPVGWEQVARDPSGFLGLQLA